MKAVWAIDIEVRLSGDDLARQLRENTREGLLSTPRRIPSKWIYDQRGSELFDEITRLPEYYLTRCERSILERESATIAALTKANTLIELGSGASEKTRLLINVLTAAGTLECFAPFDVHEATLRSAAEQLVAWYPGLIVHGIAGDFEQHIYDLPRGVRGGSSPPEDNQSNHRLVAFLGSTIGNLDPKQRANLFARLAEALEPGDHFLLGVDLVKDIGLIEAAYNDSAGVSAEFNRNILNVLNHQLEADFVPDNFHHLAFFNREEEWMEMWLEAQHPQVVTIAALDEEIKFEGGERVHTEISAKFRREGIEGELATAGFDPVRWFTDDRGYFALSLSVAT